MITVVSFGDHKLPRSIKIQPCLGRECFLACMTYHSVVFSTGKKKILKESIMYIRFFRHIIPFYCICGVSFSLLQF